MKARKVVEVIVNNFLAVGLFIFAVGALSYYNSKKASAVSDSLPIKTSLTERDLAIEEAIKNGRKEYSFETRFIPGIGVITDPQAYLEDWKKQFEQSK